MSQHSNTTLPKGATSAASEELSVKSSTGSLKKQKNKDVDVPLTDDFVLMSTPEKFKDKKVNETNAVKRHRSDSSPSTSDKIDLNCLLLSDTSEQSGIPQHVRTLLQHFEGMQLNQAEILILLVYIVALETGFIGQNVYDLVKTCIIPLPTTSSFHCRNILHLARFKPQYNANADKTRFIIKLCSLLEVENVCSDHLYALLTGFVTGDFLIITLTPAPATANKGFSTTLSIGRYVLSTQAKTKPLYSRFRKLDELSYILREQLFVPMRCQHLGSCECSIYPSLDGLPAELYDHILKYLNKNQLKILANVNKSLHNLIKSSKFMAGTETS